MENKESAATAQESTVSTLVIPVIILLVISVVCGALLAWLNGVTQPIITSNELKATQTAFLGVLPEGTDSSALESVEVYTDGVESAVKTADGLAAVKAAAAGYSGKDVVVYVAFDEEGIVSGVEIDASTQTAGIGSKVANADFSEGFVSWDSAEEVSDGNPVDTISGASYSSSAVFEAMNAAILCYNTEIKGVE